MAFRASPVLVLALAGAGAVLLACSSDDELPPAVTPEPANEVDAGDGSVPAPEDPDTFPFEKGEKIADLTEREWKWVPFSDSSCANGTPTGIGINLGTSNRLVIFLEGGGACWNSVTCYTLQTASYISKPFDEAAFWTRVSTMGKSLLDRAHNDNPFKDDSFVYIPYCTGDVHAADVEAEYEGTKTRHFGRRNFEAFLKRIVPTFEGVERVILSGSSAGGFGAAINFWRAQYAFGSNVRVDLLDDSGPPFPSSKMKYFADWKAAWKLDEAVPPGCTDCKVEIANVLPYYLNKYTGSRFALLSYTRDNTIAQFYALSGTDFEAGLLELVGSHFGRPNAAAFLLPGTKHTMLGDLTLAAGGEAASPDGGTSDAGEEAGAPAGPPVGATTLSTWLTQMVGDDAAWKTVGVPAE
jgi:hypothetical protein